MFKAIMEKTQLAQIALAILLVISTNSPISAAKTDEGCTTQQFRPRYHFSPGRNWQNDPNGLVYYDGYYHLFFQHHPYSTSWGPMHWGHAISLDLISWEEIDIALYPDDVGFIFSGSAVVDKTNSTGFKPINSTADPVVAIYTSASGENNSVQRQSIAVSLDKGMTFTPFEHNPVLTHPNERDSRDPKVTLVDGKWIMALAVNNRIEFFSSSNLVDWRLESEFGRDPSEGVHQSVWECPDLFSLDVEDGDGGSMKLWVLLVSTGAGTPNTGSGTHYFVGNFTQNSTGHFEFKSFGWEDSQWLDWGPDSYAGVTFSNTPDGRSIYMAWMTNLAYSNDIPTSTWRGQMTLPKELTLKPLNHSEDKYRLVSSPIREFEVLRNPQEHLEVSQEFKVPPQTQIELTQLASFDTPTMELEITVNATDNPQFSICAHNSDNEETCFGSDGNQWFLDRSKSGNVNFHDNFGRMLLAHAKQQVYGDTHTIRIFLDVTSLEIFVDEGMTTMTAMHFPSRPFTKFYVRHFSKPSSTSMLTVKNFDVWGLKCWYPEIQ